MVDTIVDMKYTPAAVWVWVCIQVFDTQVVTPVGTRVVVLADRLAWVAVDKQGPVDMSDRVAAGSRIVVETDRVA